jgi:hypothetical protein
MDWIRKIIIGCQHHYEKIILTVILLGLGATVWYLNEESKREEEKIKIFLAEITRRGSKEIKAVQFTEYDGALRLAQNPPVLNFSLPHNLLNPVKWQRRPNGDLIKVQTGEEVGWPQMAITRVTPLNFTITMMTAPTASYCSLGFTRDSAPRGLNKLQTKFFSLNASNKFQEMTFILKDLKGAPENPEATIELVDTGEKVTISKGKPYAKVEGYEADLKYTVNGQAFNNLRVGSAMKFLGETYNIVAVGANEVVASGSNDKKYPVRRTAAAP